MNIVQSLIEKGAKVDAVDKKRMTALMHAASKGRLEIIKLLIEKDANVDPGAFDNEKYGTKETRNYIVDCFNKFKESEKKANQVCLQIIVLLLDKENFFLILNL